MYIVLSIIFYIDMKTLKFGCINLDKQKCWSDWKVFELISPVHEQGSEHVPVPICPKMSMIFFYLLQLSILVLPICLCDRPPLQNKMITPWWIVEIRSEKCSNEVSPYVLHYRMNVTIFELLIITVQTTEMWVLWHVLFISTGCHRTQPLRNASFFASHPCTYTDVSRTKSPSFSREDHGGYSS